MAFLIQPQQNSELERWMQAQFARFEKYITNKLHIQTWTVEPLNPKEGDIVIADGTEWDPGAGGGFYGYRDGAWEKL